MGQATQATKAHQPIKATASIELIGKDEQVAQNQYGASTSFALKTGSTSGEILSITVSQTVEDAGAILGEAGRVVFFNADPATSAGDTSLAAAEGVTIIGQVAIAAADWVSDTNVGYACKWTAIPFEDCENIYVAYRHEGATTINSGATDDEVVDIVVRYREDT